MCRRRRGPLERARKRIKKTQRTFESHDAAYWATRGHVELASYALRQCAFARNSSTCSDRRPLIELRWSRCLSNYVPMSVSSFQPSWFFFAQTHPRGEAASQREAGRHASVGLRSMCRPGKIFSEQPASACACIAIRCSGCGVVRCPRSSVQNRFKSTAFSLGAFALEMRPSLG